MLLRGGRASALALLFRRRQARRLFLLAGAGVVELHLDALAFAVVGVGLAVAAAHRARHAHAEGRRLLAFARGVGGFALAGGLVAPQRRIARDGLLAAAGFVEIGGKGAG